MKSDNGVFEQCFQFVMKWEGGAKYTNDPNDPGGETKYGISKRAFPSLDIKNLTEGAAREIYREKYWGQCFCSDKDPPLAAALFDTAVNLGVVRALTYYNQCDDDFKKLINIRRAYYAQLVSKNKKLEKYEKGWNNRCDDLRKFCDILRQEMPIE